MNKFKYTGLLLAALFSSLPALYASPAAAQGSDSPYPREFFFLDDVTVSIVCAGTLATAARSFLSEGERSSEREREIAMAAYVQSAAWTADAATKAPDRSMIDRVMAKLRSGAPHEDVFSYCFHKGNSKFDGMSPSQQSDARARAEKSFRSALGR